MKIPTTSAVRRDLWWWTRLVRAGVLVALMILALGCATGSPVSAPNDRSSDTSRRPTVVASLEDENPCLTTELSDADVIRLFGGLEKYVSSADVTVDTYFHILLGKKATDEETRRASDEELPGYVDDATITSQLDILNRKFDFSGVGSGASFVFRHAGTTRDREPTWFTMLKDSNEETAAKAKRGGGGRRVLHIYTNEALSWARFPTEAESLEGVVLNYSTLPGGGHGLYADGEQLVHEVGHWLGLLHTFHKGCAVGDAIADTPPEGKPNRYCGTRNTCKGDTFDDPVENFMDYTEDRCRYKFTDEQIGRMLSVWSTYR